MYTITFNLASGTRALGFETRQPGAVVTVRPSHWFVAGGTGEGLLRRVGKRSRLVGGATTISILHHPLVHHQHAREAWLKMRISSSKMILLVLVCGSV